MKDSFGRNIDYLRVSITDRCNFRCIYCMPEEGFPWIPNEETLSAEEIGRFVSIATKLGITKVRLTGGEPLIRPDILEILKKLPKLDDLSLTTNGSRLSELASGLKEVGLHRVNISLDTLRKDRFKSIARGGDLESVLAAVNAAQEAGLSPIKINCVALRGFNDDEFVDFANLTVYRSIHVRFIEVMPIRWNLDESAPMASPHGLLQVSQKPGTMLNQLQMRQAMISSEEIMLKLESELGTLIPADVLTNGPARTWRIPGAKGTIGFISQISNDLCRNCNRIRLTADGWLRPCLMCDGEVDVRSPLRSGVSDDRIADLILSVVAEKPERHYLAEGQKVTNRGMSQIGG